jgi:hypothetical protein
MNLFSLLVDIAQTGTWRPAYIEFSGGSGEDVARAPSVMHSML